MSAKTLAVSRIADCALGRRQRQRGCRHVQTLDVIAHQVELHSLAAPGTRHRPSDTTPRTASTADAPSPSRDPARADQPRHLAAFVPRAFVPRAFVPRGREHVATALPPSPGPSLGNLRARPRIPRSWARESIFSRPPLARAPLDALPPENGRPDLHPSTCVRTGPARGGGSDVVRG